MTEFFKSEFHKQREQYQPRIPQILKATSLGPSLSPVQALPDIKALFPELCKDQINAINFKEQPVDADKIQNALRIGVVLSGGQAPGGHNVIVGVYEYIKRRHANSQLFGFLNGPHGIYSGKYVEITQEMISYYKNRGGFDMICSGRHKIETEEHFQNSQKHCEALKLDGLIVIGGDDSNTNACLLAEYFLKNKCPTKIVGCPKTIDGDLKNEFVEVSFGFDTACKTYSELIRNIMLDTEASKKYYHFIRLMGRSASHITLECALLTRPTYAYVGEEVATKKTSLNQLVTELADLVVWRSNNGMDFGVILVPEGLIEFIDEINKLITEINTIFGKKLSEEEKKKETHELFQLVEKNLTPDAAKLLNFLPRIISEQLLLDRDPHGNVQVSKIETERLLILMLQVELDKRRAAGQFKGKFMPLSHFFGYEGRCPFPTNFDCDYCYSLGFNAAALIDLGYTGVMSTVRQLDKSPEEWSAGGVPLVTMMNVETRKGKNVPVIKKALVELDGPLFKLYAQERTNWSRGDYFRPPGPIQFGTTSRCPFLVKAPSGDEIYVSGKTQTYKKEATPYAEIYPDKNVSPLGFERLTQKNRLPTILDHGNYEVYLSSACDYFNEETKAGVHNLFPYIFANKYSTKYVEILKPGQIEKQSLGEDLQLLSNRTRGLKIGVCFNGRQSPGGHTIIAGLLHFTQRNQGKLYGFIDGTKGLFAGHGIEISEENFEYYRNQGGYHFLGRTNDKVRSPEELESTLKTCKQLDLDGLVLIGATHTLTDSIILTNFMLERGSKTRIITVPSTVDGNVAHHMLEASVGFDSASKVYSQLVGNIMADAASAVKYWYFIRLMGRDPSHLVLECALQTHPNMVVISEEVAQRGQTLEDIVREIADLVCERANNGKDFGTILIPEGLPHYIPYFKLLIDELNGYFNSLKTKEEKAEAAEKLWRDDEFVKKSISPWSAAVFANLPEFTKKQLVLERDTSGGVQLSQIETERLLAHLVGAELKKRKAAKTYKGSFGPVTHFFGYQGRCSFPSVFDCNLGNSYGYIAGVLIEGGLTGYCVTARGLTGDVSEWFCGGIPLVSMCHIKAKSAYGSNKATVPSSDISLTRGPFLELKAQRDHWRVIDHYSNPGPIQFAGPLSDSITLSLKYSQQNYLSALKRVEVLTEQIRRDCRFGTNESLLRVAISNLENLLSVLDLVQGELNKQTKKHIL